MDLVTTEAAGNDLQSREAAWVHGDLEVGLVEVGVDHSVAREDLQLATWYFFVDATLSKKTLHFLRRNKDM